MRDDCLRPIFTCCHPALAPSATNWRQILALYDQLLVFDASPVVTLNRAVALAEVEGTEAGLAALDRLPLDTYYLLHAVRADLLRRLGRRSEAVAEHEAARAPTDNESERSFLEQPGQRRPSRRR